MKQKVLITGASGFIGSFLVEEALSQGFEVYAGVRRSSSREFLQQQGLRFFEMDFTNADALKAQLDRFAREEGGFDFVIHNAGITEATSKAQFHEVNYGYTKQLGEALRSTHPGMTKFVLIGSLASYGPGDATTMRPIHPADRQQPVSAYGESKQKAAAYILQSGLPAIVVCPTGVYGPRDKGFFQFVKMVNKGFEAYVGFHPQRISLIYVRDLAKAVISLMRSSYVNETYLVSDGRGYLKEEMGAVVKNYLQKKTLRLTIPMRPVQLTVSGIDWFHQTFSSAYPSSTAKSWMRSAVAIGFATARMCGNIQASNPVTICRAV